MTNTIVETNTMDDKTVRAFVSKIDLACVALNNENQHIEGYGSGKEAAYKLLCEAQAISPSNEAVTKEIESLQKLMSAENANNNGNNLPPQPDISSTIEHNTTSRPSMAEQVMQHWKVKPTIELLVCVTESNLKELANTIDSIAAQIYSNWKLTVISNMNSPDPIFEQHDILQWIKSDDFQASINHVVNNSTSDWLGLIESGSYFDSEALFALANFSNLNGNEIKIIYSDEDFVDSNNNQCALSIKPDFSIDEFKSLSFIGEFCFIKNSIFKNVGGYNLSENNVNNNYVSRAISASAVQENSIGHISNVLLHRNIECHNESALLKSHVA